MRSKIKSIVPEMKNGTQHSYDGAHGTMYTFIAELENGTKGQVSSKSPAPHRFGPGDEVEYTFTAAANPLHTGKLKIEKPKDNGQAPATNGEQQQPRPSGWSPEKEASVMAQGFIKSLVEVGTAPNMLGQLLAKAVGVHDDFVRSRMKLYAEKRAAKAAAAQAPPPPVAAPPPAPVVKPQPVALADMPEDDLPF